MESAMNAPLSREQQIELMRDADKRMKARAKVWLRDPAIQRALRQPAPGQEASTYHRQATLKVARCG
jgi:hypothetical protein